MRRSAVLTCLSLCLLGACDQRIELLRAELKRPENDYVIKLDLYLHDSDYTKIKGLQKILWTQGCPAKHPGDDTCTFGVIDREAPVVHMANHIDIVTFDMGSPTSVPGDLPGFMRSIRSVRLNADPAPFGFVRYHSDPTAVLAPAIETPSGRGGA